MPNLEQTGLLAHRLPGPARGCRRRRCLGRAATVALRDDDAGAPRGDRRRPAGRAAPQPGDRRRVPHRGRLRPGPAAVRASTCGSRGRCPSASSRRSRAWPSPARASAASAAATCYMSGRGQFGRFLIREYANRADHPEDAPTRRRSSPTCSARCSEAGLLTGRRASGENDVPGLPAARGGDPLAGRATACPAPRTGSGGPWPTRKARGSTRSSASCTGTWPRRWPACAPRSTPPRSPQPSGRNARTSSARPPCRCCTARRRWNSASTSTPSTPSACATSRPPRPTTRSAPAAPDGPGSPPWSSPTAPPATPTTSTTSAVPTEMVGGSVAPPRLDLANEDLVRSHVHAIWLAETGQDLRGSLTDVLDVGGDKPAPGAAARGPRAAQ